MANIPLEKVECNKLILLTIEKSENSLIKLRTKNNYFGKQYYYISFTKIYAWIFIIPNFLGSHDLVACISCSKTRKCLKDKHNKQSNILNTETTHASFNGILFISLFASHLLPVAAYCQDLYEFEKRNCNLVSAKKEKQHVVHGHPQQYHCSRGLPTLVQLGSFIPYIT